MNDRDRTAALARCPLFAGVAASVVEEVLSAAPAEARRFHRGAILAFRGDAYERLWVLASGRLVAEMQDLRGRVLKVETLEAPQALATAVLFSRRNRLPVQLRAETDGTLLVLPRRAVLGLCRSSERFLDNYLQDVGDRVTFLAEKLHLFRFATIRQKVAGHFLDLCEQQGTTAITLPYSIESMADLFGVARPALSRSLSELVEQGILRRVGRDYHVINDGALRELAEQ